MPLKKSASIAANGNVTLGPLGSLNVGGTINILASPTAGPTGVVGLLQTNLSTGTALSGTGFAFNADFQFEINTTGSSQQVTGFVPQVVNNTYTGNVTPNQTIAIQPGVMLEIGGTLTLVNLINIAGEFNVTIAPTSLLVTMYAHISGTLGLNINVGSTQSPATFAIDGNDSLGRGASSSMFRWPTAPGSAHSSSRSVPIPSWSSTRALWHGAGSRPARTSSSSTMPR